MFFMDNSSFHFAGKDDKHWGGHYGPMISNCNIRVKRESTSAPGDEFQDIKQVMNHSLPLSQYEIIMQISRYQSRDEFNLLLLNTYQVIKSCIFRENSTTHYFLKNVGREKSADNILSGLLNLSPQIQMFFYLSHVVAAQTGHTFQSLNTLSLVHLSVSPCHAIDHARLQSDVAQQKTKGCKRFNLWVAMDC